MKIEIKFTDGRQATFDTDSKERFPEIDKNREATFLFNNGQVFLGFADGKVDDDNEFSLRKNTNDIFSFAMPFNRLVGWRYVVKRRKKHEEG